MLYVHGDEQESFAELAIERREGDEVAEVEVYVASDVGAFGLARVEHPVRLGAQVVVAASQEFGRLFFAAQVERDALGLQAGYLLPDGEQRACCFRRGSFNRVFQGAPIVVAILPACDFLQDEMLAPPPR